MARILVTEGQRIYVATTYGEPAVAALKQLRAHWDRERKLWWVGTAKRKALEDALVGSDEAQDDAAAKGEPAPEEDPDSVRLVGKCRYKGRDYYARFAGPTRSGYRCRLTTLDGSVDFWAPLARPGEACDGSGEVAVVVKEYKPREVWDGRRYSGRTVTRHTTLGSIRRFLEQQQNPATRRGECTECGSYGPYGEPCPECGGRRELPVTHLESLRTACDATLAASLPAGLKAAVDAALAAGGTRRDVLARVRRLTGGPRPPRGGLTCLAVAAYLRGRGEGVAP